jgi:hypothetical protein
MFGFDHAADSSRIWFFQLSSNQRTESQATGRSTGLLENFPRYSIRGTACWWPRPRAATASLLDQPRTKGPPIHSASLTGRRSQLNNQPNRRPEVLALDWLGLSEQPNRDPRRNVTYVVSILLYFLELNLQSHLVGSNSQVYLNEEQYKFHFGTG